jgi:pSer/pThr/pTyr-binding forkhead associated (FHA) protein
MDVILKVLEGAKGGAKVTIKKPEFLIGRSQECHLCAGSSAVSRKHCAILRTDNRVAVKDLGSRNGTLVNGKKIEGEVELASGDEITVGPLKFLITLSNGLSNVKRPEVKSVAEAVVRAADAPAPPSGDGDVSQWLLEPSSALNETQTIRMDDTNAVQAKLREALAAEARAAAEAVDTVDQPAPEAGEAAEGDEKKADEKRAPGKLPKTPVKPSSKDSREAAAEALRAWSRRR